jgi:hypothetical protein
MTVGSEWRKVYILISEVLGETEFPEIEAALPRNEATNIPLQFSI